MHTETVWAHSPGETGLPQPLWDHLQAVAEQAAAFAAKFSGRELAYWAGLWHDLGKIHPDWQAYLARGVRAGGPDHKGAGAVLSQRAGAAMLAFVIAGHHGGLPDQADLKNWIRDKAASPYITAALRAAQATWPNLLPAAPVKPPPHVTENPLAAEFLLRFLLSALVDADRLDTEAHFTPNQAQLRTAPAAGDMWPRLEHHMAGLSGHRSDPVGQVRHRVYTACLAAADLAPGFFRLTVPTGGGKTLSSLAFALRHAQTHRLERVIVAIPYTSIIEQTAEVYRQVLGAEAVLEHHSNVELADDPNNLTESQRRAALAAENWDAPVVVTTTVQLFESLFAARASRCRKLHNLARSVLILDEVQTLPTQLLEPILDSLRQLVAHYGVTVVLCTATQPAFSDGPFRHRLADVQEIVPEPAQLFTALRRVEYTWPGADEPWLWDKVATEMRRAGQVLAIVNTRADARELLAALQEPDALHLSTLLCGAHRRDVLAEVRRRLAHKQPCRLVSTQVVEAGVDLDFPLVLRALGPLDRIVQAAGRCNREGRLAAGQVVVFLPATGRLPPGSYKAGTELTRGLLSLPGADLHDPDLYGRYFRELYGCSNPDEHGIQALRTGLNFARVAEKFQMIADDTVPVLVSYNGTPGSEHARRRAELEAAVQRTGSPDRRLWRQMQPYVVQVRRVLLRRYQADALVSEICPGLWQWLGKYDPVLGLTEDAPDPADLLW